MTEYVTIEGFEQLTEQEAFDISAKHVLKNGRQSVKNDGYKCVYTGIGCGASPFIREEHRARCDEGVANGWTGLASQHLVPEHLKDVVHKLQRCHDYADKTNFVEDYKTRMASVANDLNLNPAVLEGASIDKGNP